MRAKKCHITSNDISLRNQKESSWFSENKKTKKPAGEEDESDFIWHWQQLPKSWDSSVIINWTRVRALPQKSEVQHPKE